MTVRVASVLVAIVAAVVMTAWPSGRAAAEDGRGHEIVIQTAALDPPVLRAWLNEPVTFVNRSQRVVHIELTGEDGEHHVFQVPGTIWAQFHRPGRHPYVVHFSSGLPAELHGAVEVEDDPDRIPTLVCGRFTVSDVCIAP